MPPCGWSECLFTVTTDWSPGGKSKERYPSGYFRLRSPLVLPWGSLATNDIHCVGRWVRRSGAQRVPKTPFLALSLSTIIAPRPAGQGNKLLLRDKVKKQSDTLSKAGYHRTQSNYKPGRATDDLSSKGTPNGRFCSSHSRDRIGEQFLTHFICLCLFSIHRSLDLRLRPL